MSYLSRQLVRERLRLGERQSYRIVGASYTSLIDGAELLDIVNAARRGIREPLTDIPSDLLTPEEMVVELGDCVTERKLMSWTRRRKNVPPHFRFNKQTTRFSSSRLREWIRANSKMRMTA